MASLRSVRACVLVVLASCAPPRPRTAATVCPPPPPPEPPRASSPPAERPRWGTYWVRRVRSHGEGRAASTRPGERREVERYGTTACEPLVLREHAAVTDLPHADGLSLRLRRASAGWVIDDPAVALSPHRGVLRGACAVAWDEAASADAAVTLSAAGPLFHRRERCAAAAARFRQRCVGDDCAWDDPLARPFTLGACEAAVAALRARAALLAAATHADAARTHAALVRLAAGGGRLFEPRGGGCDAVTVTPAGRAVVLTRVYREAATETTERARYELEPLFARAALLARSSEQRSLDGRGGRGAGASSGGHTVSLHLAAGVILLGDRLLYLRAARCPRGADAAGPRP